MGYICDKIVGVTSEFGKGSFKDAVFTDGQDYLGIYERGTGIGAETLFGRCDQFGHMTHMCYGSSYVNWNDFLTTARENKYHYFDAGGNHRPVRISAEELEKAMKELGLI